MTKIEPKYFPHFDLVSGPGEGVHRAVEVGHGKLRNILKETNRLDVNFLPRQVPQEIADGACLVLQHNKEFLDFFHGFFSFGDFVTVQDGCRNTGCSLIGNIQNSLERANGDVAFVGKKCKIETPNEFTDTMPRKIIPSNIKTLLAYGAIYIIWGSTYLGIKYALQTIPPFFMMGIRSLSAGAILYLWSRSRGDDPVKREHWPALIIIGTLFFLIGHGLLGWAQQKVPSGLAALLVASEPLWIVTIESFVLRDARVRLKGIAGLILGFAGVVLLITSWKGLGTPQGGEAGALLILLGALSWSIGAVYSRVALLPRSPALAAGLELIVGGALLIALGFMFGEANELQPVSLRSLLSLAYLALFGSVVTFSAYVWLLSLTSATRVSTHAYVNPVIAVLLGWTVAGEQLNIQIIIAAAIIVVSVYLVLKDQLEKESRISGETHMDRARPPDYEP